MKRLLFLVLCVQIFGQFGYQGGGGTTVVDRPTTVSAMTSLYSIGWQDTAQYGYGYVNDTDLLSFTRASDTTDRPFTVAYWMFNEGSNKGFGITKGLYMDGAVSTNTGCEWEVFCHSNNQTPIMYTHSDSSDGTYIYNQCPTPILDKAINKWIFVVAVYDGSETATGIKMYLDGKISTFAQTSIGTKYKGMVNDTGKLYVGLNRKYSWFWHSKGLMDNIGIWNKALSDSEVTLLYNNGNGVNYDEAIPDSLKAYWDFEEGTGSIATDKINGLVMNLVSTDFISKTPVSQGNSESMYFRGVTGGANQDDYLYLQNFPIGLTDNTQWSISWWQYLLGKTAHGIFSDKYFNVVGEHYATGYTRSFWTSADTNTSVYDFKHYNCFNSGVTWSGVTATKNTWNKIVLTCDGTDTLELFINNVSQGKKYLANTSDTIWYIGRLENNNGYSVKGWLDEIKVYNTEIDSAERANNSMPTNPFTSNLIFYYDCNKRWYDSFGKIESGIQRLYPFMHRESMVIFKGADETGGSIYFADPTFSKNVPFKY